MVASNGEGIRKIKEGAVRIDGQKIADHQQEHTFRSPCRAANGKSKIRPTYPLRSARSFATRPSSTSNLGVQMGREDVSAGQAKQVRGKINDVVGAIKGDSGQQLKGKAQVPRSVRFRKNLAARKAAKFQLNSQCQYNRWSQWHATTGFFMGSSQSLDATVQIFIKISDGGLLVSRVHRIHITD